MTEVHIILPPVADQRDPLEFGLISLVGAIAQAAPDSIAHGCLGGEFGYGALFENDIFLMHPHCWCDREGDCPWCTGCAAYERKCARCAEPGTGDYAAGAIQGCDYSAGRGIFARFAPWALDHATGYYDPPNFWHKPSGLRVTWYKWIGRETTTNGVKADLAAVFAECVASLKLAKVS